MRPRGLRNNNPGNIRRSGIDWDGQAPVQTDPDFVQFIAPKWGIRAMARILRTYRTRPGVMGVGGPGVDTLREIVYRWAPPSENDSQAYLEHLVAATGIPAEAPVRDVQLPDVVAAIIRHENGVQPYSLGTIRAGVELALGEPRRTVAAASDAPPPASALEDPAFPFWAVPS